MWPDYSDTAPEDNLALDAVYVLSIPSFNWQKANYTPALSRTLHTCEIIGNRQMVVVGGSQVIADYTTTPDPWTMGLGIFDLTEMVWSSQYDAQAPAYVTPQVVKQYYSQNGLYPPTWDSPLVESWIKSRC